MIQFMGFCYLPHLLFVDNRCKQFGPISGLKNVGPDLGPNCLTF